MNGSAGVAQLVEHHLAKVDVEGSNPFARSIRRNAHPIAKQRERLSLMAVQTPTVAGKCYGATSDQPAGRVGPKTGPIKVELYMYQKAVAFEAVFTRMKSGLPSALRSAMPASV